MGLAVRIAGNGAAGSGSGALPGFTIGTLSCAWVAPTSLEAGDTSEFDIFVPVTPPSDPRVLGGHLYLEIPDTSFDASQWVLGSTPLGSGRLAGAWNPQDYGQFSYVASQQPWRVRVRNVAIRAVTDIRVYVQPYSATYDPPPVQANQAGATPSAVVAVAPNSSPKPASGANVTGYLVPGISATVGASVYVNGRLQTPISVTVDLTGLPNPLPDGWAYQLLGYANGDLTTQPVLASGYLRTSGLVASGADGISTPHTFGPVTPATAAAVVIYAVAGLMEASTAQSGGAGSTGAPVFVSNNIVAGITASATVTFGAVIASVSVAEAGSRFQNPPGGNTYTTIRTTPAFSGVSGAVNLTEWFSLDGGSTWTWQGVFPFQSATSQDVQIIIPLGSSSFIARVLPGSWPGGPAAIPTASLPAGTVASNTLSLAIGAPSSTGVTLGITNLAGSAPTVSNIFTGINSAGGATAQVLFSIAAPGNSDTAPYFYDFWLEWTDASGNPVNPGGMANTSGWQHYWETPNDGRTHKNNLVINYPAGDYYLTIQVWGRSRNSTADNPPFSGDPAAVLQQWPGGLTYYRLHVGRPPGGANQGTSQNTNQGASILTDWSFEFSAAGLVAGGTVTGYLNPRWSTTYSTGSIAVNNGGGNSGSNYVRLTGPSSQISQNFAVQPGQPIYVQVYLRSNNPGGTHSVTVTVYWYDSSGALISSSVIGSVSGYVSSWTLGPSGAASAPAGAASAGIAISNSASETSSGYWDVDDVFVQPVPNQTSSGQTGVLFGNGTVQTSAAQSIASNTNANPWYGTPTSSRALGVTYQNLTGKLLFVCVVALSAISTSATVSGYCSPANPPTGRTVASQSVFPTTGSTGFVTATFPVPANYYYTVVASGSASLSSWAEYE
jgi:hypothetical protein